MFQYFKESWCGDSRDGSATNTEGFHFFRMEKNGKIVEAYEFYEEDSGDSIATPLPEMVKVNWIEDLGFEDFETLDQVDEVQFNQVRQLAAARRS